MEKRMYAKKFEETKYEEHYGGNRYYRILHKEVTRNLEMALVKVKKGGCIPKHLHRDEEQVYIILKGRGLMRVGNESREVEKEMVIYIPPGEEHKIENIGQEELIYIYTANWLRQRQIDFSVSNHLNR